eukprot:355039-Chlamydomonas_euryale.AAC.5
MPQGRWGFGVLPGAAAPAECVHPLGRAPPAASADHASPGTLQAQQSLVVVMLKVAGCRLRWQRQVAGHTKSRSGKHQAVGTMAEARARVRSSKTCDIGPGHFLAVCSRHVFNIPASVRILNRPVAIPGD